MSDDTLEGMIRQSTENPLPILRILETRDIPYVEMDIEGEEDAMQVIVNMGKEVATDEDYFNIGLTHGLKEAIKEHEANKEKSK
jgi:hypothetical protein